MPFLPVDLAFVGMVCMEATLRDLLGVLEELATAEAASSPS
jgi:hypothetical protein